MLKLLYPRWRAESVFSIDYPKLYNKGFRGVIFDIDNTLVHHGDDATEEVEKLFLNIHSIGLKTLLLTNNDKERTERFLRNIDSFYVCDAEKPKKAGYFKALNMLKITREQAVVIGDQIFTDILGANRCGIASILVDFIRLKDETDFGKRRKAERIILDLYTRNKKNSESEAELCRKSFSAK